ncbi:ABC transporter substrate-binding protein, partial [Thermodesulfobacteriota bacterium]
FTLKRPFAPFARIVAHSMNGISPPEEVLKWQEKYTFHPVGTGPYKIVEANENKVVLERFDDYWGPKPYIDRVEYIFIRGADARLIAIQKGDVDVTTVAYQAKPILEKEANLVWEKILLLDGLSRLFFNFRRWPMNDIRFRKAIWMGADWRNINIMAHPFKSGNHARTYLEYSTFFNQDALKLVPPYDPKEAKKLIQAVEKDAGKKIPPMYWLDTDQSIRKAIAEMAKIQLAQIGVPLNLNNLPRGIRHDKLFQDKKIEWDIAQMGLGFGAEPYIGFSWHLTDSGAAPDGKSLGGYGSPEFDGRIHKAIGATNADEMTKYYQQAEKVLLKDIVGIPLYPSYSVLVYRKNVKGTPKVNPLVNIIVTNDWTNMWLEK